MSDFDGALATTEGEDVPSLAVDLGELPGAVLVSGENAAAGTVASEDDPYPTRGRYRWADDQFDELLAALNAYTAAVEALASATGETVPGPWIPLLDGPETAPNPGSAWIDPSTAIPGLRGLSYRLWGTTRVEVVGFAAYFTDGAPAVPSANSVIVTLDSELLPAFNEPVVIGEIGGDGSPGGTQIAAITTDGALRGLASPTTPIVVYPSTIYDL